MNKVFADKRENIYCDNCQDKIAVVHKDAVAYKLSCICNCSSFVCAEHNAKEAEKKDGAMIYIKNGNMVCPVCGSVLLCIEENAVSSFAFRIKCSCGEIYSKRKEAPTYRRNLGVYAINDK